MPAPLRLIAIAETGERYTDFAPVVPAIDDHGAVAFWAALGPGESAIVLANADERTLLARTGARYADFVSHPAIDGGGGWCAYARLASGERTVVGASQDGVAWDLAREIRAAGPLGPTVNRHGDVAFRGDLDPSTPAIFVRGRGGLDRVAVADGRPFTAFHGLPVIDDAGTVVFRADSARGPGIYARPRVGAIRPLADPERGFASLSLFPCIDRTGVVAFAGTDLEGHAGVFSIDASAGAAPRRVVEGGRPLPSIRGALVAGGRIVFFATPEGGTLGIYDSTARRVLGIGDAAFGSRIADFALNPVSINAAGTLAIRLSLASGRQVIARGDLCD